MTSEVGHLDLDGNVAPEMICRRCEYVLRGLKRDRCPECGCIFDPDDPQTYHTTATPSGKRYLVIVGCAVAAVMVDLGVAAYMSPLVWQLAFMSTSVVSFLGYFTAISVLVICRPALRKRYPEERDDHALRSAYLIAILLLLFGAAGYVATLIRIFL